MRLIIMKNILIPKAGSKKPCKAWRTLRTARHSLDQTSEILQ